MQIGQRSGASAPRFHARNVRAQVDRYAWLLAIPFLYAHVISPLAGRDDNQIGLVVDLTPNIADRVFWPLYAVSCVAACLAARRFRALTQALQLPHMKAIVAFMVLAGSSVVWSSGPELTAVRFALQLFVVAIFVSGSVLAYPGSDFLGALYRTYAIGALLNSYYVITQAPHQANGVILGYMGYFSNKNTLGFFCASAFLLALIRFRGSLPQKLGALLVLIVSGVLLVLSQSKGALAFAIVSPVVAGAMVYAKRRLKISPATSLFAIVMVFYLLSVGVGDLIIRISNLMYGNPTLSNRTIIWDFLNHMIDARPILGAGYRSVWLVPPEILAQYQTEPWVKLMPHGHNGYLDMKAELGYVGYAILLWMILAVYYVAGRIAMHDARRGWVILTLATFCVLMNFVESSWFRGYDPLWMLFMIAIVECIRGEVAAPKAAGLSRPLSGLGRPAALRANSR